MYLKPTKQMHTDGRMKSLKGIGGRGFPPANMSMNPITFIGKEKKRELKELRSSVLWRAGTEGQS